MVKLFNVMKFQDMFLADLVLMKAYYWTFTKGLPRTKLIKMAGIGGREVGCVGG